MRSIAAPKHSSEDMNDYFDLGVHIRLFRTD